MDDDRKYAEKINAHECCIDHMEYIKRIILCNMRNVPQNYNSIFEFSFFFERHRIRNLNICVLSNY